ncbi:MAG: DNA/RNA nuclease SfsA [Thermodesulfobacteriota bacterium]
MKFFREIVEGRFVDRPNRFLVLCKVGGKVIPAFLPNPGRLQELLLPDRVLYLSKDTFSKKRKYLYTVVATEREGCPIMLHTQRTNDVTRYLLQNKMIPELREARFVGSEIRIGRNRFDFLLKEKGENIILEVKSCTLFGERIAMFPDALTERGSRHLLELARLSEEGFRVILLFIVHWPFAEIFMPDYHTDFQFSKNLLQVREKVQILAISVRWNHDLSLSKEVKRLYIPWSYLYKEVEDKGSYLLVLKLEKDKSISIGRLGPIDFREGFYIYVGSAMANLSRRMERHRRLRKRYRWHIDELRSATRFNSILPIRSNERLECHIAKRIAKISERSIEGFGSTDCSCFTHLFWFSKNPLHLERFHKILQYFRMDRYWEKIKEYPSIE